MSAQVHSVSSSDEEEEPDLASRVRRKFAHRFSQKVQNIINTETCNVEFKPTALLDELPRKEIPSSLIHERNKAEIIISDNEFSDIDLPELEDYSSTYRSKGNLGSQDSGSSGSSLNTLQGKKENTVKTLSPKATGATKERKLLEKEAKRKEREAKKEEKERLKKERENERTLKRATKPGECLKYVVVEIDRKLLEKPEGSEIVSTLLSKDLQYKAIDQQIPFSVSFSRLEPITGNKELEDEVIVVVPVADFVSRVRAQVYGKSGDACYQETAKPLLSYCREWMSTTRRCSFTAVVCGLEDYFREKKSQSRKRFRNNVLREVGAEDFNGARRKKTKYESDPLQVTRIDVESSLVAAQIELGVNFRLLATPTKVADFIGQMAKAIAERPFKLQKETTNFSWYAEGSNSNCVKVDKTGVGLMQLWRQQLRQFSNVGPELAQAIVKEYPSPQVLLQMYRTVPYKDAIKLVADIPVRRGVGVLANTRRIGAELSKKIYTFFNSDDPDLCL